jgi:rhodanese-related sulfurtransferase
MIIDLRTDREIARYPVPSDIIINTPIPPLSPRAMADLREALSEVAPMARGETIQVFCAKGNRSKIAASILRSMGYRVVDRGGVL